MDGKQPWGSFKPPKPSAWHHRGAQVAGATMWLWIMYRFKQDGDVLLGWRHPWEHKGGDHGHH